jgi:UDP-4-amino-4,6-dideoxy-N-acetyl-beta-L-altrosamine transaminase
VPERRLPYGRQWVTDEDVAAVVEVLRSDFLTTGPLIGAFERTLGEVTGTSHAVAVNSGTAALHAMYYAAGLGPGDEIITSPLTFAATGNAALYLGATVRFVDVATDTGNLDPEAVEAAITDRTRLIVAVDYAGHPADYDALSHIADAHGVTLLADAAHALGATYHGRRVGTLAHATALSFHPVKPITTGEGGAVVTDDDELARRAREFRTHGVARDTAAAAEVGPWYYEMTALGFNYRLTDIQAALGQSQLRHLDEFLARRRVIAGRYTDAFAELASVIRPGVREGVEPGWHLYPLRVAGDPAKRRPFFDRLQEAGVGVQVHYIPVYWHPYYRSLGFERGACPRAEDYYLRVLSLPLFPRMTDADVEFVIDTVTRVAETTL